MMAGLQRSQASFDFCHDPHADSLLQRLQKLRSDNQLVDITLCVSGKEIPCHRNVLAACSEYFHAMFCNGHRESNEHKVTIHEVNGNAMQLLVDYAYTSEITITEDNAAKLLEAANFFQIQPVRDACVKFISKNLNAENCLQMLHISNMLSCPRLEKKARWCALTEFAAVSKTTEFLSLTKDQLITFISSDSLNASEETVYTAVMAWINHDTRKRRKEMKELMELVRFPFMDRLYFLENVESNDAVRKSCQDIVMETRKFQLFPGEVQSPRTCPRLASGWTEEVVVIGGIKKLETEGNNAVYSYRITANHGYHLLARFAKSNYIPVFAAAVLGTTDIILSYGRYVTLYQRELGPTGFSTLHEMNTERHDHKLAVLNGKVYAIGGKNDAIPGLTSVEVYDRRENVWEEGVALPQARHNYAIAVLNCCIYVIGGYDAERKQTSTVYRFKPGDSHWQPQRDMPVRGAGIAAAALNGNIYVAGLRSKMLCFTPSECGGSWSVAANTGVRRMCGMTVFAGKIHIYGGYDNGNGSEDVMCFDPANHSFEHVGYMNDGLFAHACVTILRYENVSS